MTVETNGSADGRALPADAPTERRSVVGRAWLWAIGLCCGLCELSALAIYTLHFTRGPWQDWMVYYAAARAALDGQLPVILDASRFTAHLNAAFAGWLPEPFSYRSWVYPPPFLLLLLPFGLLSFAASCLLFQGATLVGLVAAVSQFVRRGRRALVAAAIVLSPPAAFNFGSGQNGFLTTALLVGGFGLLDRRPELAGTLLGSLIYKPQFCPLALLALVASRQWRALAAALTAAAALALASVAIFGVEPWRIWLGWAISPPPAEYQSFLKCCLLHDESVFTNLVVVGAPGRIAAAAQLCAVLAGAGAVWRCYRRKMPRDLQVTVLLSAGALAAPHFTNYDAVLLITAAALLLSSGFDRGLRPELPIVCGLVFVLQLFNPPDVFRIGIVTPLLTLALIACAIRAAGIGGRVPTARPS